MFSLRSNGGSLGLKVGQGTPPAEALASIEQFVLLFEGLCSHDSWRDQAPAKFRAYRAYARLTLATLDYLADGAAAGFHELSASEGSRLDELRDRLDELLDTLGWAADCPGDLAALAESETCA